jgi:hypothetical protein
MHVTSKVEGTAERFPADAAGENFSLARPDNAHHPMEDLQLLTDEMLASIGSRDEEVSPETPADAGDFEEMILQALDTVGGKLLFQMRLDNGDDCQHVAAITLGEGDRRQVALVILNAEGAMRLEPVETSDNPVAGLARSYVSLAEAYQTAA